MKYKLQTFGFLFVLIIVSNNIFAQIQSAQSGEWTAASTWVGGVVPTLADDVHINATHEIAVSDATPKCKSITFGADDATIDMNANGLLSVYGNFTLFSTSHNAFSGWSSTNSFIKFMGNQPQSLNGWNDSGSSTSFRDVIIDKSADTIRTDGTGMRLCIQNSLTINNGVFELNTDDDLEGRWNSSGNFHEGFPEITVNESGEFTLLGDGWHHIRAGYESGGTPEHKTIGKLIVYGRVELRNASSRMLTFKDVDIKDGGQLILGGNLYSSSNGNKFHPGTLTVESGGYLGNYTSSNIWDTDSLVDLQNGGTYKTATKNTFFPTNFSNNGIVEYDRTSDDTQNITDMDYNILKIKNENVGNKLLNITANRSINSVIIENEALLNITGSGILTINNEINHLSGNIDANSSSVVIQLGSSGLISENELNYTKGEILTERYLEQGVNHAFGNLGIEINADGAAPGTTSVTRYTDVDLDNDAIRRYYDVNSVINTGLNATVVFHYLDSELNGLTETDLILYAGNGTGTWTEVENAVINTDDNTVTATSVNDLDIFTLGNANLAIVGINNILQNDDLNVEIYPNPFKNVTTISVYTDEKSKINFEVYNLSGKKVADKNFITTGKGIYTFTFNGSTLNKGTYICKLNTEKKSVSKQIVIVK